MIPSGEVEFKLGSSLSPAKANAAAQSAEVSFSSGNPMFVTSVVFVENSQLKCYTATQLEEMALQREIAKHTLPLSRLVKLVEKSPPPQSWYDEEDLPF